jgi:hypothetical protein
MLLPTPDFDLHNYSGDERKKMEGQRDDIKKRYNEYDFRWRNERETIGLLMSYFHHGQPEVVSAWLNSKNAVTIYMDCANKFYSDFLNGRLGPALPTPCVPEAKDFRLALDALSRSFEVARAHALDSIQPASK